jgi:hypothetical protein
MKLLSGKKQNFWSWNYSPQVPEYQGFWIIGCQIKGILLQLHLFFYTDTVFVMATFKFLGAQ